MRREMLGIELMEAFAETGGADNDVFAALGAECEIVHGSADFGKEVREHEISHTFGVRRGIGRE